MTKAFIMTEGCNLLLQTFYCIALDNLLHKMVDNQWIFNRTISGVHQSLMASVPDQLLFFYGSVSETLLMVQLTFVGLVSKLEESEELDVDEAVSASAPLYK